MSGNGSWLTVPLRERDGQGRKGRRGAGWRALQANRPAKSGTGFFGTQARSLSRAERHPMIDRLNKHLSLTRQCQYSNAQIAVTAAEILAEFSLSTMLRQQRCP